MITPSVYLGDWPCSDATCVQNIVDGKLALWASAWQGCSGPSCVSSPTHLAFFRVPSPTSTAPSRGPGEPVATVALPKGYNPQTTNAPPTFVSTFKQGDCFAARAYVGAVADTSVMSPLGPTACVGATTPIGTEDKTYPDRDPQMAFTNTCPDREWTPPDHNEVATRNVRCTNAGNRPAVEKDSFIAYFFLPFGTEFADFELTVPSGARCGSTMSVWWNEQQPVSLPLGAHGDAVTLNLDASLPNLYRNVAYCEYEWDSCASEPLYVGIEIDPDPSGSTPCTSPITSPPTLRVRQFKTGP